MTVSTGAGVSPGRHKAQTLSEARDADLTMKSRRSPAPGFLAMLFAQCDEREDHTRGSLRVMVLLPHNRGEDGGSERNREAAAPKPGAAGHFNQHSVADRLDTELGKDEIGFFKRWQGLLSANLAGLRQSR